MRNFMLFHTYIVSEYHSQLPDLVLNVNGVQPGNRRTVSHRMTMAADGLLINPDIVYTLHYRRTIVHYTVVNTFCFNPVQ